MTDAHPDDPWSELKYLLRVLVVLFGEPASLREDHTLVRDDALTLRAWLRGLERIARALLLILAARLPAPAPARRCARATKAAPPPAAPPAADDDAPPELPPSERWAGVAFRALPPASGAGRRVPARPQRFFSARPLAFRFEALIRVAAAPEGYARRLARRLRAAPELATRVLGPPPVRGPRPRSWDDLAEEVHASARPAVRAFAPGTG